MSKVKVHVRAKDTCGRVFIDPICELTKHIKDIKRSKTLAPRDLIPLVHIGYKIEYTGDRLKSFDDLGATYLGIE